MTVLSQAPENKFAYVVVASRRARQLMAGAPPMVDQPRSHKPTRVATEELNKGVLEYKLPDDPAGEGEKEGKRRKS